MEDKSGKEQDSSSLQMIQELIHDIQYGSITIIIQDGRIVQIEKNEKHRIKS